MIDKKDIEIYGPEWIILELIAKGNEEEDILKILENCKISWGELLEQSISHKIVSSLAYTMLNDELCNFIPPYINQHLKLTLELNKYKNKLLKEQTKQIVEAFKKRNIEYVCTKGIILNNTLYENKDYRYLSDIDFMMKPKYRDVVQDTMKEIGFCTGRGDWKTNQIRELSREEYLREVYSKEKIPEYVIKTNKDIITFIAAGFVTDFVWEKCPYKVDIEEAFKYNYNENIGISNVNVNSLSISYHYVYIILHLFKHAWVNHLSEKRNDVNLTRFGDVYRYWNKYSHILKEELPEIIQRYNIYVPILWTLKNTDIIFKSNITDELNIEYADFNEELLNSTSNKNGSIIKLKGNIRDRLKSKERTKLIIE